MIHLSQLMQHASLFPADRDGHVPEATDDWRKMHFDHGPLDPEEPGISAAEKQRRTEHLDKVWWPQVLRRVREQHESLKAQGHETPFKQWMDDVRSVEAQTPTVAQVDKIE
jgi:hypothetical protein